MKNVCIISVKKNCLEKFHMIDCSSILNSRVLKVFCLLFLCTVFNLQAQETTQAENGHTVKGIVVDEENLPLGGVNVVLKGTKEGVVTDLDGRFEFPRQLDIDDVLVFSYIGYNPQDYAIATSASETSDITITFDLSNISLMGAVEVDGVYSSKRNIFQKLAGLFK